MWTSIIARAFAAHEAVMLLRYARRRCATRSLRRLAVEPPADVGDRILVEASVEAAGDVADMWRCQQVRQRAERMVERQRLLVEDIDGCASDLFVFKRRNEIGLDDDRSARRVYQA